MKQFVYAVSRELTVGDEQFAPAVARRFCRRCRQNWLLKFGNDFGMRNPAHDPLCRNLSDKEIVVTPSRQLTHEQDLDGEQS